MGGGGFREELEQSKSNQKTLPDMRNSKNGFRTIKHKLKAALSGGLF